MTYSPPNRAAELNFKSRALKKLRAQGPGSLSSDQREYLSRIGHPSVTVQPPPRVTPPPQAAPARAPEPAHVHPSPSPSVVAPPPRAPSPDFTVIDFGSQEGGGEIAKTVNQCPPGCQHLSHAHAAIPRCAQNGEKQYPPFKDNAAKGLANGSFFVVGFIVAIFRGMELDEIPDPTPGELEDGKDAIKEIIATRAPQLGIYSDLMAGGFAVGAYGTRALNVPRKKKS